MAPFRSGRTVSIYVTCNSTPGAGSPSLTLTFESSPSAHAIVTQATAEARVTANVCRQIHRPLMVRLLFVAGRALLLSVALARGLGNGSRDVGVDTGPQYSHDRLAPSAGR